MSRDDHASQDKARLHQAQAVDIQRNFSLTNRAVAQLELVCICEHISENIMQQRMGKDLIQRHLNVSKACENIEFDVVHAEHCVLKHCSGTAIIFKTVLT